MLFVEAMTLDRQTAKTGEVTILDPPYTLVYNDLICDNRLRLQTRAALILMLSRPPDWDFSVRGMARIAGVTKDTMSKMIRELETAGYIQRKQQTHEAGRFGKGGFIVSGEPIFCGDDARCPKSYDTILCHNFSYTKKSYTKNYDELNNNQVINKQDISPKAPRSGGRRREAKKAPDWKPERFEKFWQFYPIGKSKQAAIAAWDKLRPDDALIAKMGQALKRQMAQPEWQRGVGIPYASTWLNQRRWEDELRNLPEAPEDDGGWAEDPEVY